VEEATSCLIRSLAETRLIVSTGQRKSRRGPAHSRKIELWAVRDEAAARLWLATHPDLDPNPVEAVTGS
jgi:hypothetical protein